jgi:hypothetical protein
MRVPRPSAPEVLTKSPKPSIAATAAVSNGLGKNALARCAGWCSTSRSRGPTNDEGNPSARPIVSGSRCTAPALRSRSVTMRKPGLARSANAALRSRLARGLRDTANRSTSRGSAPAAARHALAARSGNPAQCFTRRRRSSSMATTRCPSRSSAADASP